MSENPLDLVEPPPLVQTEAEMLDAGQIAALIAAYHELEALGRRR